MKNLSMAKSKDLMSEIVSGQTARLYNNIGTHLLDNSCKMTSSEALLPTFPKIAFAERQKERLALSNEHLKYLDLFTNMPK